MDTVSTLIPPWQKKADETIARLAPLTAEQKAFVYEHERRHSEIRLRNHETDFPINSKLERPE